MRAAGHTPPLIVVTDLDGTLLDHHSYSLEPAMAVVRLLQQYRIPLVFNTSKTSAESQALSEKLALSNPFIVENGSAIYFPKRSMATPPPGCVSQGAYWVHIAGISYAEVLGRLQTLKTRYRFANLGSTPLEDIMAGTGLGMADAQRAMARQYSEPLVWQDTEKALTCFRKEVLAAGMNLLRGGRYLHVLGNTDKGRAMKQLKHIYDCMNNSTQNTLVMALGDSHNDLAMLQAADIAAVVRSPVNDLPDLSTVHQPMISKQTGPAGWAECVSQVLAQHGIH